MGSDLTNPGLKVFYCRVHDLERLFSEWIAGFENFASQFRILSITTETNFATEFAMVVACVTFEMRPGVYGLGNQLRGVGEGLA